jgi:hypothetical protein
MWVFCLVYALAVASKFEQLTARNHDGSLVLPGGDKYRIFTSDKITSVDLSSVGHFSPEFSDDGVSILNICAGLEVGAVPVLNCPGFEFMFFAQQGGVELQRIRKFLGNIDFPIIGYHARPPMDADGTHYSIFEHDIRATFIQWRMGVEQANVAYHINAGHVMIFLKKLYEQVLHSDPQGHQRMILKYRQLYAGCSNKPPERRAISIANFVKYVPVSALLLLTRPDTSDFVLPQRVLDKPWKRAMFPEDVACKLLDGLTRLRINLGYFSVVFDAYYAASGASGEQLVAISKFERELSGGAAGPFSEDGIASGNPCSAFALFSECRANDMVDGSQDDGTLGDLWDGLSAEVKGIYAAVATTIVAGQPIRDLKTKVEVQRTQQAQVHAPERGVPSGQQPQVLAFFLFSLSCSQ